MFLQLEGSKHRGPCSRTQRHCEDPSLPFLRINTCGRSFCFLLAVHLDLMLSQAACSEGKASRSRGVLYRAGCPRGASGQSLPVPT